MNSSDIKKKVGILGASGYTGGEMIRLLIHHPHVQLTWLFSRSYGGQVVSSVHQDLLPYPELVFTSEAPPRLDILFLCAGHGVSETWLKENNPGPATRVIDLSSDFRLGNKAGYVYGLPEWNKKGIAAATRIANPGCFATAVQLSLLPFLQANALPEVVHIQATTGSTGAGQSLSETTHFTWRTNNLSVYKAFSHQHEAEWWQLIRHFQKSYQGNVSFIPQRGPFTRGILSNMVIRTEDSLSYWKERFDKTYRDEPFVHVSDQPISLKEVVNTNHAFIHLEGGEGQVLVTTAIDNLLKGASGQAVQNMNIMMGWEETTGLHLKPIAY